jgi:ribulose-5-phosphate 4-epimerase/fuculose-1-phosphate aldolase
MEGSMSGARELEAVLTELVMANRVLAREEVVDDFGHVSVRDPRDPARFWLSRSRSPELVVREDLIRFDLDARPEDPGHRKPYLETILHARIYAARPDVTCVVHHHARPVLPYTVLDRRLRPVFHMGSVIGAEVPVWDSLAEFGDTNLLIDDPEEADSLARALGPHACVLLKRHGAVCVGAGIPEACFVSIYMKENAALQFQAEATGLPVDYLTPGEIEKAGAMLRGERPLGRAWQYRIARAGFAPL